MSEEVPVASAPRVSRERKQVERLAPEENALSQGKTFSEKFTAGTGTPLAEIEYFCNAIENVQSDEAVFPLLHTLFFGGIGKTKMRKRQIKQFAGFPEDTKKEDLLEKVKGNKKWTLPIVRETLGFCGLEKGGEKDVICERMIDYLMAPSNVKEVKEKKTTKKRPSSSSSEKTAKKAKKGGDKADKVKRAPTSFILFSQAKRLEIKEANPDATFTEMGKLLGAAWKEVDAKEKAVWDAASKAAAAVLAASPKEVTKKTATKTKVVKSAKEAKKAKKATKASKAKKGAKDEAPIDFGSDEEEEEEEKEDDEEEENEKKEEKEEEEEEEEEEKEEKEEKEEEGEKEADVEEKEEKEEKEEVGEEEA